MAEIDWPDLEERIILRKNYLEELINKALQLPEEWRGHSFTQSKFWHREELGIYPVISKRDWNKKTGDHRGMLVLIDIALKQLNGASQSSQPPPAKRPPLKVRFARLKLENEALKEAVSNAVADWHVARSELELANKDARSREVLIEFTQRKLDEAEAQVRQLAQRLHARGGLTIVGTE